MVPIIAFIAVVCIAIGLGIVAVYFILKDREIIQINTERQEQNQEIESQYKNAKISLDTINSQIADKNETLLNLNKIAEETRIQQEEVVKAQVDKTYQEYTNQLEAEFRKVLSELNEESSAQIKKILAQRTQLKDLEDKQATYIREQQHKEEMLAEKDYYRLVLSPSDEDDIKLLRDIQVRLAHKEAIDKVIWDVYYKPAYDILMAHIFDNSSKVCGIYKITCISNDKAYVGQSVDIKERFKQHIKSALSSAPSTNKLYQEMKKQQPSDFLFEVLEEVPRASLNERETYWIDIYKTKDYGLNNTKGGS